MPLGNGFDRSYYLKDQSRFFNPTAHWKDDVKLPPVPRGTDFYGTTVVVDHVLEFLQQHQQEYPDRPFFQYLAFAAPHFPLHALPEDIQLYRDRYVSGWDTLRRERWNRLQDMQLLNAASVSRPSSVERNLGPPYHFPDALEILGPGEINRPQPWTQLTSIQQQFQSQKMAIHAAMIHRMDLEIGRVFEQIRSMGQWDNTIVVFLSDNGASAEIMVRADGHDSSAEPGSAETYLCLGPGWSTVSNTPFRRHKTWTHEGGISTPLLVSWPEGIAARGEVRRNPSHVIDIVPTLLELAGVDTLHEAPPAPGKSLLPVFERDGSVSHDSLWWFHDGHRAVRMQDWKAVKPIGEPWELYDLSVDRIEAIDLAVAQHDVLQRLVDEWDREYESFQELASADLSEDVLSKAKARANRSEVMNKAQEAGRPRRTQVLPNGRTFFVEGRHAFVLEPERGALTRTSERPWIFYAPTLSAYPDQAETWMHQRFLDAGVAVAGIDVGEAYGSPQSVRYFDALYDEMVAQGYSRKPALLGRSRGGLWVSRWALSHPDRIAGIGGIYPVFDFTTYPGLKRAAPAYGLTPDELSSRQAELNPVRKAADLARSQIPMCIIHGTEDKVVPIAKNSAAVRDAYRQADAEELIHLIEVPEQGHNFWEGFFRCEELIDFLIEHARGP